MNKNEFRDAFSSLPPMGDGVSRGDYIWNAHRLSIRQHALNNDIDDLLRWSTITATMFVGQYELTNQEMLELQNDNMWPIWKEVIKEPGFGNPHMYDGWTSGNLINQAYYIQQWMKYSGKSISDINSIVEFGGGYGALALVCHRLGNRDYTIIDFEELGLIQKYYLSNLDVPVKCTTTKNIPQECDLFIACYSLSEAPSSIRKNVLDTVRAKNYFIAYQYIHDGVNIKEEFHKISKEITDVSWRFETRKHIAYHTYLIGERT